MEANAGLVAGSHNRNELVVIPAEGIHGVINPSFRYLFLSSRSVDIQSDSQCLESVDCSDESAFGESGRGWVIAIRESGSLVSGSEIREPVVEWSTRSSSDWYPWIIERASERTEC